MTSNHREQHRLLYQKEREPLTQSTYLFLFLTLAAALTSSCTVDPRKEAEAFKTRTEAEQQALTDQQNREQSAALFELEKQRIQAEIAMEETNKRTREIGWNIFIGMVFIMGTGAVAWAIVTTARSTTKAYERIAIGMAEAAVQAADIKSRLIPLDPTTGTFPLIVEHVGKGVFTLTDPNTATVIQMDTRQDGDRLMIQGAMATRHTYVLSQAASKSQAPAGVSIIEAPSWSEERDE